MTNVQEPPAGVPQPHWQPGPPSDQTQQRHNLTTPGFVVALVGAVLSLVPLLGVVSWIISPIGLVLSVIAVSVPRPGRAMAGWGVGLGAFGLLVCFAWAAAIGGGYSSSHPSSSSGYGSSSSSNAGSSYSSPSTAATTPGTYSDGTYVVGSELAPGRYRTSGADSDAIFKFCVASREQTDGSAIGMPETTNEGPAYVTVQSSDSMVKFSGPCSWTKVG